MILEHGVTCGVIDRDDEFFTRKARDFLELVGCLAYPELTVDILTGLVNRSVCDTKGFGVMKAAI